jgi:hypothetical protein
MGALHLTGERMESVVIDPNDLRRQPTPVCPQCGHAMTVNEMTGIQSDLNGAPVDLIRLAPDELVAQVVCPIAECTTPFWVSGGYKPLYATALDRDGV